MYIFVMFLTQVQEGGNRELGTTNMLETILKLSGPEAGVYCYSQISTLTYGREFRCKSETQVQWKVGERYYRHAWNYSEAIWHWNRYPVLYSPISALTYRRENEDAITYIFNRWLTSTGYICELTCGTTRWVKRIIKLYLPYFMNSQPVGM